MEEGLVIYFARGVIIFLVLTSSSLAVEPVESQKFYRWSLAAVAGSQAADVASSWGGIEANPVLGAGRVFGPREAAIKCGVVAGAQFAWWYFTRRHPKARRILSYINFGTSAATTAVAVRNWRGQ